MKVPSKYFPAKPSEMGGDDFEVFDPTSPPSWKLGDAAMYVAFELLFEGVQSGMYEGIYDLGKKQPATQTVAICDVSPWGIGGAFPHVHNGECYLVWARISELSGYPWVSYSVRIMRSPREDDEYLPAFGAYVHGVFAVSAETLEWALNYCDKLHPEIPSDVIAIAKDALTIFHEQFSKK